MSAPGWRFIIALLCLLVLDAHADERIPNVGILTLASGPNESIIEAFRTGLRQLNYVEGQSVHIEFRGAEGRAERLPGLAEELVKSKVDVIVTGGGPQVRAAVMATSTIPIVVIVHEADPTASGLIESYRRPGGNVTGIYAREGELTGKRLELFKEALPQVRTITILHDAYGRFQLEELEAAAHRLGVALHPIQLDATYDFEAAFRDAKKAHAGAAMILLSPAIYVRREQLGAAALHAKLSTMHQKIDLVRAGGLMSYGPEFSDTWGRAAYFVDRILKGGKPSELPVEQVAKFNLVVSLKTAKALGIKIPQSILVRADEVIR